MDLRQYLTSKNCWYLPGWKPKMKNLLPCGCFEGEPHLDNCRVKKTGVDEIVDLLDSIAEEAAAKKEVNISIKDTNPKASVGETKVPLFLASPITKVAMAISQFLGKTKYGSWNWRAGGARASTYISALHRHVDKWQEGEEFDEDGTPHLWNALACLNILIESSYRGVLEDDRPPATDLRPLYKQAEEIMKVIRDKYGHMTPHHYTQVEDPNVFTTRKLK